MQLAYLDESKTDHAYYITALCVADRDAQGVAAALDEVMIWAVRNYGAIVDPRAELHGVDLIGGKGAWKQWRPPEYMAHRYELYERAIDAIAAQPVRVWIRGANLAHVRSRYSSDDVHGIVLPWALERVQMDAERMEDVALVIADEVQRKELYRRQVASWQEHGTYGWRDMKLNRLVDTLHFAPSDASRLLQAADLVSYVHTQTCREHKRPETHATWWRMWGKLAPALREASTWPGG